MSSDESSSTADNNVKNLKDPSGFLNLDEFGRSKSSSANNGGGDPPPRTAVKIIGTARDDLNGLLGFCTSYNTERERYMIRMSKVVDVSGNSSTATTATTATIMALKPTNLQQASTIEKYQAHYQQLFTDPAVRQKVQYYYNTISNKYIPPYMANLGCKLEYVVGILLVFCMTLIYLVGFTKSMMVISATIMIGLILQEDIQQKSTLRTIVQNIPARCKIVMEQQFPFLKRFNFNDNIAMGIVDSIDGNKRGHSLSKELQRLLEEEAEASLAVELDEEDLEPIHRDIPYSASHASAMPTKTFLSKLFSIRTMGSLFYFYRTATSLGIDPSTNIFSFGQLVANVQHSMPSWQKGMMVFSFYNLISNLFF
ncbi:hypothetical protein FRACYDRAFT_246202 [Fragilariopsis cylindrus CCMP1102]|uniref:Uncharacterized protein n=1 Tax=Fragilariopsis cylindrus CCMP1102 TaxID=635003 RepID=A0A1E7EZ12_9STRA|nr:hypothetical protein FRACYDRAFT_246202 [Fragilariopsis cylindrus CCMP1102]|eukprot:OEU11097.1 hypothetical protein FRACYDRAFT_246202 [Fragilariopsis cylindrus CCMP1102]